MDRTQRLTRALLYCNIWAATKISHTCKEARAIFFNIGLAHYFRYMTPREAIAAYVKYYQYLPAQGSPDWLTAKKNIKHVVIGGSELATVLGINPYQKLADLAASKLGRSTFSGSMATYWGNTFEPVLFSVSDDILNCERYETGSVPGLRRVVDGQYITAYSPDGLAAVGLRRVIERAVESLAVMRELLGRPKLPSKVTKSSIESAINEVLAAIKYMERLIEYRARGAGATDEVADLEVIALFEGKCPIGRIAYGFVPGHYKPQIWMGACTIPIVKICIFTDGMFRRCTLNQWRMNNAYYDKSFHYAWSAQPAMPKRIGFIGIFTPDVVYAKECALAGESSLAATTASLIDFGAAAPIELELALKNVVSHRTDLPSNVVADGTNYFAYYPAVNDQSDSTAIDNFVKWAIENGYRAIGVLPWKLLNIIHTPVIPKPLYMEENRAVIEMAVTTIQYEGTLPWTQPLDISPAPTRYIGAFVDDVPNDPTNTDIISADIFSDVLSEMSDNVVHAPKHRNITSRAAPSADLFADIF